MTPKPSRSRKIASKSPATPLGNAVSTFSLPKLRVVAQKVPVRISAVAVQSAHYSERPNPTFALDAVVPSNAALDLNLRADYGWAGDHILVLTAHANLETPEAPMMVSCQLSLRVAFERDHTASAEDLWSFVKEAGLRMAFPFIRTHIATLTAMGSLGSLIVEPLMLAMVEPSANPE